MSEEKTESGSTQSALTRDEAEAYVMHFILATMVTMWDGLQENGEQPEVVNVLEDAIEKGRIEFEQYHGFRPDLGCYDGDEDTHVAPEEPRIIVP